MVTCYTLYKISTYGRILDVPPDGVIPTYADLCAGYQLVITRHLCHRVQRAMAFANTNQLIPEDKQTLVSTIKLLRFKILLQH